MNIHEVRAAMPRVGDRRLEILTTAEKTEGRNAEFLHPKPCTVVEVHPDRLWYRVLFDSGFTECYKAPEIARYLQPERKVST